MAAKLTTALQKLRLDAVVYEHTKNYFLHQVLRPVSSKKLNYASLTWKLYFQNVSSSIGRRRFGRNYGRVSRYVPKRQSDPQLGCPKQLFPGKFLDKGCSAAIVSVANVGYESKIILKQPYKYYSDYSFDNESGILSKLSTHPNIIQFVGEYLTDICQDPNFWTSCPDVDHHGLTNSIILERMDMNLENLLNEQELTMIDRIDVLTQILEAQVFMSKKSICHRDLKPSNILVKYAVNNSVLQYPFKFIIKVADFDCAVDLNDLSPGSGISHQGTPVYMAPEILNSPLDSSVNGHVLYSKSDIWTIGTIAYEIFKNENPFTKISAKNYSLNDLPVLESAPKVVQKLVKCLLDPDASSRYQSCIASDILQLFRMRSILPDDVFDEFKRMSLDMMLGCCYFHQMYLAILRFAHSPQRIEFAIHFIEE